MNDSISYMDYICPACRGEVTRYSGGYECHRCKNFYPLIYDIPDFRLAGDAYLTLEEERTKARTLAKKATIMSFSDLVDFYYSITNDVPVELVPVYLRAIINGPDHLAALAHDIETAGNGPLLDAGCGSGSLLLALAGSPRLIVGLDIALRWLVICRKRLEELGINRQLVCADILQPPFREQSFAVITGIDLIEHTRDSEKAAHSIARLIQPGGCVWLTVSNRYTPGPHPSTRLWAIGYLPKKIAGKVSQSLRGVDSLRHIQFTTPVQVIKSLKRAGFELELVQPKRIADKMQSNPPPLEQILIGIYRLLCRRALSRHLLVWLGPISEIKVKMPNLQQH